MSLTQIQTDRQAAYNHYLLTGKIPENAPSNFRIAPPTKRTTWAKEPRLVNRFLLGADPEFVFHYDSTRRDAELFDFKTGIAFGADLNGRLAELRPQPSRSALHLVASMLSTLRWMLAVYPLTGPYFWHTGAYAFGDGLGGHIHFGRKSSKRAEEIQALDMLCELLRLDGCFNSAAMQARRAHTHYGRPGDYRLQAHGYEYRSMPSWLNSPWLAFYVITLSKLVVHNPELFLEATKQHPENVCKRMLQYYQSFDDDAALAYRVLRLAGLPTHANAEDFRAAWGIPSVRSPRELPPAQSVLLPPNIAPHEEEIAELYGCLLEGRPPKGFQPRATWSPLQVPTGFRLLNQPTAHAIGIGELQASLVSLDAYTQNLPLQLRSATGDHFRIHCPLDCRVPLERWNATFSKLHPAARISYGDPADRQLLLSIGGFWREKTKLTRKMLTSGLFPLWDVFKLDPKEELQRPLQSLALGQWRTTPLAEAPVAEDQKPVPPLPFVDTLTVGPADRAHYTTGHVFIQTPRWAPFPEPVR